MAVLLKIHIFPGNMKQRELKERSVKNDDISKLLQTSTRILRKSLSLMKK